MPKYSVKKPMTVFVVIVIIIALGVVSLLGMTPDLMPSIDSAVCSRDDYVSGSYAPGGGDFRHKTSGTGAGYGGESKEYAVHIGGQLLSGHNGI